MQMRRYRDQQVPHPLPQVPASPVKPKQAYMKIISKYQLKGKQNTAVSQTRSTDEEEFSRYKTGSLSPPDTDLIQFWEVCVLSYFDVIFKLFVSKSFIKRNILDYTPLPWTTSPYRHHPFHASTSSRQPAKRIPRNVTDYHPNSWRPCKF
jgi:hypothetical protein